VVWSCLLALIHHSRGSGQTWCAASGTTMEISTGGWLPWSLCLHFISPAVLLTLGWLQLVNACSAWHYGQVVCRDGACASSELGWHGVHSHACTHVLWVPRQFSALAAHRLHICWWAIRGVLQAGLSLGMR
jgi:hypothetical protein